MKRTFPLCLLVLSLRAASADEADVKALLAREIVGPRQARLDVAEYVRARIPKLKPSPSDYDWAVEQNRLRQRILDDVVFRGEGKKWRTRKVEATWLDEIDGGAGYKIKKLRFEALPGLWIPALLYEPDKLPKKVPVMLAVNGHDRNGKAADYKQARCVNLAKRGIRVLNVEWLGMGQLAGPGFGHGRMNQLDLCGTSGVGVFHLAMRGGLDVLLSLKDTDKNRVGVSGLSGGGWQTIFLSALDTRVTLCNPVAGYSSFLTRLEHGKDLGDSEQTPTDLATIADYTHLTAMLAPRPTLLTYNAKDECCFESGYALPPLEKAARPMFKLFGKEASLRTHVNLDPGTHNYGKDNREALYRLIGAHWFRDAKDYDAREIDVEKEIKKAAELAVELPKDNADFNTLATKLMKDLPRRDPLPEKQEDIVKWQGKLRLKLADTLRLRNKPFYFPKEEGTETKGDIKATYWKLRLGEAEDKIAWTVPVVELAGKKDGPMTVLLGDGGRKALHARAHALLEEGRRVMVIDPFYNGESSVDDRAYLFALMVATIGERPLGLQWKQLEALQRWLTLARKEKRLDLVSVGPRSSVAALAVAGSSHVCFDSVTLHEPLGSLKEIVEKNTSFEQMPELFCFGLLETADVADLARLIAPRKLAIHGASERGKKEFAGLKKWHAAFGQEVEPLQ